MAKIAELKLTLDRDGTTDIWNASEQGSLNAIKYWYSRNASYIKRKEPLHNDTPLHLAAQNGHLLITKFLLLKKVNVNERDFEQMTPLMIAAKGGHFCIVDLLIQNGASQSAQDIIHQWTPLHFAVLSSNFEIVRLLVEKGANTMIKDMCRESPLDLAKRTKAGVNIINYLSFISDKHSELVRKGRD